MADVFQSDPLLRLSEVEKEVGLGRSAIYRRMKVGEFPLPLQLGGGVVRWQSSDIAAWRSAKMPAVISVPPSEVVAGRLAPPVRRRRTGSSAP